MIHLDKFRGELCLLTTFLPYNKRKVFSLLTKQITCLYNLCLQLYCLVLYNYTLSKHFEASLPIKTAMKASQQ